MYYGARFFKAASDGTVSLLTNTTAPPPDLYFSSMFWMREFVRGGYRTRARDRAACCDNLHPIPISIIVRQELSMRRSTTMIQWRQARLSTFLALWLDRANWRVAP